MWTRHHLLLGALLLGNALLFAGVDAATRLATAVLVLALMLDLRQLPELPRAHRWASWGLGVLVLVQLLPLPVELRNLLQPGFAELAKPGWAPLSVAPWATIQVAASVIVVFGIALVAARMASTRTGLPALLATLAVSCGLIAVLGLAGEAGTPEKVLLVRANTLGGDAYGPFVNSNHFAVAIELTLPAAMVLLAVGIRNIRERRTTRQRSMVVSLAAAVTCAIGCAAMLRSGSRGGLLFLILAAIMTLPLWWRKRGARRWIWLPVVAVVAAVALGLASTRLDAVREGFSQLLIIEGVEGNDRWDLWQGTFELWQRSPLVGCGLGAYRYAIGLDKPATGGSALEQAHNDWLEWLATGGLAGALVLALAVIALVALLRPASVRRLRFEYRYPLAGAGMALAATALHETVGFALQTPLNRYLLAAWIGLVWGLRAARAERRPEEAKDDA
jgi:O-antigen ligase